MRKNKKKKTIQYSKNVNLQLDSEDILEFLDFLKVAESNKIYCASANKIKRQLHELVLSRIECREPKPFIQDTEDFLMQVVDDKMVKIALEADRMKSASSLVPHAIGEIMRVGPTNTVTKMGEIVSGQATGTDDVESSKESK